MRKTYFIFKDMKEATYYFRNIACELAETNQNIERFQNEKRIVIPRTREEKGTLLNRVLVKLGKAKRVFVEDNLEINFKSTKSKSIDAEEKDIYTFSRDEYDTKYFIKLIDKI